jgi:hypothetical protein
MAETLERRVAAFEEQVSPGSWFLMKESDIEAQPALLPYAHYLRQAWEELDLKGVLCVDGRPVVYLCGAAGFTRQQKRDRHRFVWNQGLATILIFLTPSQMEVHSAVKKPEKEQNSGGALFVPELSSLIATLGDVAETLEIARLVRSIETGQFFQRNALFFPPSDTVDRSLLKNLVFTARKLEAADWSVEQAHALLGRALFVSFLHAREFIKPDYFPEGVTSLLEILSQPEVRDIKRLLYREFFARLKREFNGTMFDAALDDEERHIKKEHLDILAFFLGRHDVATGQMMLDFWAYDFRYIPVEIISAIYEEFMEGADSEKKRDDGAYYTPRHLAETALHIALEGRYADATHWKALDPACGSGIFLVAMFNLIAEQWRRNNATRRKQTKAQALLDILQNQIRGVDNNLEACRIAAFSLYLALFEKLQPMDVEEFKEKVSQGPFLPSLLWDASDPIQHAVVVHGDFLKDDALPLERDFDLVVGNPPWDSRGRAQIALQFVSHSEMFLRENGVGCLLLPSAVLVNRNGALDGDWFRKVTVEKLVQLADYRFVLFEATHPCFILRYMKAKPSLDNVIAYETPKLSRFDRRQGVIVVEPDDQKSVTQRDVLEASLQNRLQSLWNRKFWGTPRDEAFLRRLDFYPQLSESTSKKKWRGGVGFQPFYPGVSTSAPQPLETWTLSDRFLPNRSKFPKLVLQEEDFTTLKEGLEMAVHRKKKVIASQEYLRRKPDDHVFSAPMVVFSKGFTKAAFSGYEGKIRFLDGLRSITGPKEDADLLRFLAVVLGSRLFKYITFHSGSNVGIGRDQIHLYESLALPFPLPSHEFSPPQAEAIVTDVANILKEVKRAGQGTTAAQRAAHAKQARRKLDDLVEAYFSVSGTERILIDDTLAISQPSIHRRSLDGNIPSLVFPGPKERTLYAETLCDVLNRLVRKQGIAISAQGIASDALNLIFVTVIFDQESRPYSETAGEAELWDALGRVDAAARRDNGPFSYLRGFSYFESDRLHMLKPATMRNWSRTAALNDADAIFEHLTGRPA